MVRLPASFTIAELVSSQRGTCHIGSRWKDRKDDGAAPSNRAIDTFAGVEEEESRTQKREMCCVKLILLTETFRLRINHWVT